MANQDTDLRCYLTNAGIAAENNSIQLGRKLPVKEMVFGSGLLADGSDPRLQTTMIQEEYAVPCGMLFDPESPTLLVFKGDLPADVGGFHINEVAIRLEDGTLYGYARGKGDYKPTIEQGATDSVRYAVEMYTTNASNVECKIDLSKVYVDWEDLEARIKAHKSEPEPHSQYHKAEEQRLICLDNYGHTAFVDGFDVTQQADPNKYKITPGVLYVGGLRAVLSGEVLQTITTKPNGIYIDVVRDGTALSAWENTLTIKVSTTPLNDHVDEAGRKHYVAKLAGINANGSVVDWRVKGGLALAELQSNAATDGDIDSKSSSQKHVKLPQLWRAFEQRNVVHEVTRNENVLLPAGSPVQLTWNSVKHNTSNIFEPGSNLFRAKKEGWYDVRGLIHYTPVSGSPTVYIHALVNGVLDGNSRSGAGGAGSGLNAIGVSAKVYLMVGDTLGLYLFTTAQINQNTFDDDDHNFFQLIYKGK